MSDEVILEPEFSFDPDDLAPQEEEEKPAPLVKRTSHGKHLLKFTPEVREKVLKVIQVTGDQDLAASFAGIDKRTLSRWLDWGRDAEDSDDPDDRKLYEFYLEVEKARANPELRLLSTIAKVANGYKEVKPDGTVVEVPPNWQAAAKMLEMINPSKYRDRKHPETPSEAAARRQRPINIAFVNQVFKRLPDAQLEALEQLASSLGKGQLIDTTAEEVE